MAASKQTGQGRKVNDIRVLVRKKHGVTQLYAPDKLPKMNP